MAAFNEIFQEFIVMKVLPQLKQGVFIPCKGQMWCQQEFFIQANFTSFLLKVDIQTL